MVHLRNSNSNDQTPYWRKNSQLEKQTGGTPEINIKAMLVKQAQACILSITQQFELYSWVIHCAFLLRNFSMDPIIFYEHISWTSCARRLSF